MSQMTLTKTTRGGQTTLGYGPATKKRRTEIAEAKTPTTNDEKQTRKTPNSKTPNSKTGQQDAEAEVVKSFVDTYMEEKKDASLVLSGVRATIVRSTGVELGKKSPLLPRYITEKFSLSERTRAAVRNYNEGRQRGRITTHKFKEKIGGQTETILQGLTLRSKPRKGEASWLDGEGEAGDMLALYNKVMTEMGKAAATSDDAAATKHPYPAVTVMGGGDDTQHRVMIEGLFTAVSYTADQSLMKVACTRNVPAGSSPPSGTYVAHIALPRPIDPTRPVTCERAGEGHLLAPWILGIPIGAHVEMQGGMRLGAAAAADYAALLGMDNADDEEEAKEKKEEAEEEEEEEEFDHEAPLVTTAGDQVMLF